MRERLMDKSGIAPVREEIDFLAGLPWNSRTRSWNARRSPTEGSFLFGEDSVEATISSTAEGQAGTVDSEGREQIIGICSGRDTIWEGMLMEGGRYPYAAACLTDVDCCRIFRRDFTKILADPIIALRVIALMSQKLREANARNLLLTTSDSKARLAGFLAGRARQTARMWWLCGGTRSPQASTSARRRSAESSGQGAAAWWPERGRAASGSWTPPRSGNYLKNID
jgi:hypothetical protein